MHLHLAPRALGESTLRLVNKSSIIFAVLLDARKLSSSSLLLDLCHLLCGVHLAGFHVEDIFLDLGTRSGRLVTLLLFSWFSSRASNNWQSTCIFGGFVSEDLSYCDGSTFVTDCEATQLRNDIALFKSNGNTGLDAAQNLCLTTCKLRLLLFNNFTSLVLFIRDKKISNGGFICNCVNVNHALVTLWNDRLVGDEFIELDFSLENLRHGGDLLISMTNNISFVDSIFTIYV